MKKVGHPTHQGSGFVKKYVNISLSFQNLYIAYSASNLDIPHNICNFTGPNLHNSTAKMALF